MKLYNRLTKKLENFVPKDPKNVKIYTCGPTVYSFAHIGNLAAYIYWDLLIAVLERDGNYRPEKTAYKINRVMNITDVGHLASDADTGEDKLEKGAKKEGKTVYEIADFYTEKFLEDFHKLDLREPAQIVRATSKIEEEKDLVSRLIEKGYTYETADGIYFDTEKFKTYADFAGLDLENLKAGARVEFSSEKKHPSDFAVWKFVRPGEDHAIQWDFLGRPGYPGWHLECSAIIHACLGEPIDIHTGGIDHIPVHHTNEIAESEAAYGVQLSRFWIHCSHIMIENQKISKSLGNIYTLEDLKEKGFSPLDYKLWVLQGHYQGTRNFNFEDLSAAKSRRLSWTNRFAEALQINQVSDFKLEEFHSLLADNLRSPEAFAYIDTHTLNAKDWEAVEEYFRLGLSRAHEFEKENYQKLAEERSKARENKDYETADRLRAELEQKGLTIKDTAAGPIWQYLG